MTALDVLDGMNEPSSANVWILIGAVLFLIALAVSALVIPELRILHLFQALIYVAVMILAKRNSAWGFGAGFSIGVAWNSLNLFITHLMQRGAIAFWSSVHTGHVQQLVPMTVLLGGIGHFVLIIACPVALLKLKAGNKKWWQFVGGGALALAYFALLVSFARPH